MIQLINIADLKNPDTGKTYREENNALTHKIPLGVMVEVKGDEYDTKMNGLRLWVVKHTRDCDGTPLYGLSFDKDWSSDMFGKDFTMMANARIDNGYPEESLTVCGGTV